MSKPCLECKGKWRPMTVLNGKSTPKARAVYMQHRGPIPPGMVVCHSCDNDRCYEITHLWLGTQGDNIRDMYAKGRTKRKTYRSLTAEQVEEIRASPLSSYKLAPLYGCSPKTISNARKSSYKPKKA